jgi:hypothetical protein
MSTNFPVGRASPRLLVCVGLAFQQVALALWDPGMTPSDRFRPNGGTSRDAERAHAPDEHEHWCPSRRTLPHRVAQTGVSLPSAEALGRRPEQSSARPSPGRSLGLQSASATRGGGAPDADAPRTPSQIVLHRPDRSSWTCSPWVPCLLPASQSWGVPHSTRNCERKFSRRKCAFGRDDRNDSAVWAKGLCRRRRKCECGRTRI